MPPEMPADFAAQLKEASSLFGALNAGMSKSAKSAAARQLEEERRLKQLIKDTGWSESYAKQRLKLANQEEREAQRAEVRNKAIAESVTKALGGLKNFASGAISSSQAAYTSSEVFSGVAPTLALLGDTVKTVSNIFATAFTGIPILGGVVSAADKAVAAVTDITVQVAQMQLQNAQQYLNTYNTLSKVGVTFGGDIESMRKAAAAGGMALDSYSKFIQASQADLATLGGTIQQAAGRVMKMSNAALQSDARLLTIYGSYEDVNSALATYSALMAGYGVDLTKNQKSLTASAVEYLYAQKELTSLTGISADRYKKEEAERQTQVLYQRRMMELTEEQRLQMGMNISKVGEFLGPEAAKAMTEAVSKGGTAFMQDPDNLAYLSQNPEQVKLIDDLRNSSMLSREEQGKQTAMLFKQYGDFKQANRGRFEDLGGIKGVDPLVEATNRSTAITLANFDKLTNMTVAQASLDKDRKADQTNESKAVNKALEKQRELKVAGDKRAADSIEKMGDLATLLYDFNKTLIEKFGNFGNAIIDFGLSVDKLLEMAFGKKPDVNVTKVSGKDINEQRRKEGKPELSEEAAEAEAIREQQQKSRAIIRNKRIRYNQEQKLARGEMVTPAAAEGIKLGDKAGTAPIDPRLQGLLSAIGKLYPGSIATGLNDDYHMDLDSNHNLGKAVDFTVPNPPRNAEEAIAMREKIKGLGFGKVLDEYFTQKSKGSTGNHFHAELKDGGITNGPSLAGEAGPEAVVPLPNGRSIPVQMDNSALIDKLDQLLSVMKDQHSTSEQILYAQS